MKKICFVPFIPSFIAVVSFYPFGFHVRLSVEVEMKEK